MRNPNIDGELDHSLHELMQAGGRLASILYRHLHGISSESLTDFQNLANDLAAHSLVLERHHSRLSEEPYKES
jgi:hypothetical protein